MTKSIYDCLISNLEEKNKAVHDIEKVICISQEYTCHGEEIELNCTEFFETLKSIPADDKEVYTLMELTCIGKGFFLVYSDYEREWDFYNFQHEAKRIQAEFVYNSELKRMEVLY